MDRDVPPPVPEEPNDVWPGAVRQGPDQPASPGWWELGPDLRGRVHDLVRAVDAVVDVDPARLSGAGLVEYSTLVHTQRERLHAAQARHFLDHPASGGTNRPHLTAHVPPATLLEMTGPDPAPMPQPTESRPPGTRSPVEPPDRGPGNTARSAEPGPAALPPIPDPVSGPGPSPVGPGSLLAPHPRRPRLPSHALLRAMAEGRLVAGPAQWDDGRSVPYAVLGRWLCDPAILRVVFDAEGQILDYGHTRRLYTGAMRRAILARDRHCVVPGCTQPPDRCEVHHLIPWSEGGVTSVANGVLLCWAHHEALHNGTLHLA